MDLETFVAIVGIVLFVIGGVVEHYLNKNVYLTYKDQKVGGK